MILLRPIEEKDFNALLHITSIAQLEGAHLPTDRQLLSFKLQQALTSFRGLTKKPNRDLYLFILEDSEKRQPLGISAISAQSGGALPLSTYHIRDLPINNPHPAIKAQQMLYRQRLFHGPAELSFLFLLPNERKPGYGRLLSLARLLFIAAFPTSFPSSLMTAMKGASLKNGLNPFWEGLGRHFLDVDSHTAWELFKNEREDLDSFFPTYPIYLSLLPKETQQAIGKVNPNSRPAFRLLKQEGFELTHDVHSIDGGPYIECKVQQVRTIRDSTRAHLAGTKENIPQPTTMLIANLQKEQFCCCYGAVEYKNGAAYISKAVKQELGLKTGDPLIFTPTSSLN